MVIISSIDSFGLYIEFKDGLQKLVKFYYTVKNIVECWLGVALNCILEIMLHKFKILELIKPENL